MHEEILAFWFGDLSHDKDPEFVKERFTLWFKKSSETDELIRKKFGKILEQATKGMLDSWAKDPDKCLALIILLDQFSRNLFRGNPRVYAQDEHALSLAYDYIAKGWDKSRHPLERAFIYLPMEHCEDLDVQNDSVAFYEQLEKEAPEYLKETMKANRDYAEQHRDIVVQFGRFPHRNAILGRVSTAEEEEFLKQPGSSF